MNSALHDLSADEFWLVRLFRCLSEEEQHDALVTLAEEVLLARLAADTQLWHDDPDTREWLRREAIDQTIESLRPFCEIEHHVGDWWTNILESLFQDGMPHALLGSEDYLEGYEANLLECTEHTSEMQDLALYESKMKLAEGFLREWRSQLIRAMEERAVRPSTDGRSTTANTEGKTPASIIPFGRFRRQRRPEP
jgi:hypothetical protein